MHKKNSAADCRKPPIITELHWGFTLNSNLFSRRSGKNLGVEFQVSLSDLDFFDR